MQHSHSSCARRIFTERITALTQPSARRTNRLTVALQQLGLALGGETGAQLGQHIGLPTSSTTILRLVRQPPDPTAAAPQVVAIDDFAFRMGQTYGTIVIDHQTGKTIDLLADRKKETVAAWLRAHPEITIVTRDRDEVYAQAATLGAPQAIQLCDRWQLLLNMSETLDELLIRLAHELASALDNDLPPAAVDATSTAAPVTAEPAPAIAATAVVTAPPGNESKRKSGSCISPKLGELQQQRRTERLAAYQEVCRRREEGQTIGTDCPGSRRKQAHAPPLPACWRIPRTSRAHALSQSARSMQELFTRALDGRMPQCRAATPRNS